MMAPNVLISWSKSRSKTVAEKLHAWLPKVIPNVVPWISSKDIAKGKEWFRELQTFLGSVRLCIICVTRDNIRSPWLYYEVGAIATKLKEDVSVCPFLIDVDPQELQGTPLSQFMCTVTTKDDVALLMKSLNGAVGAVDGHDVGVAFDSVWPLLQRQIKIIVDAEQETPSEPEKQVLTDAEVLAGHALGPFERKLLLQTSFEDRTVLSYFEATGGCTLHAGGSQLFGGANFRELEEWKSAIRTLVACQCLRQDSRQEWRLTPKGFKVADAIRFADFDDLEGLSKLSSDARRFLLYATEGEIIVMEALDRDSVTLNGRELICSEHPLGEIKDALRDLELYRLLRQETEGFYEITKKGRKVAAAAKLGE